MAVSGSLENPRSRGVLVGFKPEPLPLSPGGCDRGIRTLAELSTDNEQQSDQDDLQHKLVNNMAALVTVAAHVAVFGVCMAPLFTVPMLAIEISGQ
jgi:hypothetical protein